MLWLTPPPYLRRFVAAVALVVAVAVDLVGSSTVDHPFVTSPVAAGQPVDAALLEYRPVPAGLLTPVPDPSGFAVRSLESGDPLTPSALSTAAPPPTGWWAIRAPLPDTAAVGARVRLISAEPAVDVVGVVTAAGAGTVLGDEAEGMVAVPPEAARLVAEAATRRTLSVLVGT